MLKHWFRGTTVYRRHLLLEKLKERIAVDDANVIAYGAANYSMESIVPQFWDLTGSAGQGIGQAAVMSHGDEGALVLSSVESLTSDDRSSNQAAWSQLGSLPGDSAVIDLCGCEIGERDTGQSHIQTIADFADVVAAFRVNTSVIPDDYSSTQDVAWRPGIDQYGFAVGDGAAADTPTSSVARAVDTFLSFGSNEGLPPDPLDVVGRCHDRGADAVIELRGLTSPGIGRPTLDGLS